MTAAVLRAQVSPGADHKPAEHELFHHDFTDQAGVNSYLEALGHIGPVAHHWEHVDAQRVVPSPVEVWLTDEYLRRHGVGSI